MSELPRLVAALPTLAAALRESLLRENEPELAAQVDEALIFATCACDDEACLSVHLAPRREPCVGRYRVVTPDAVVTVGVCRGRLDWIEDNDLLTPARDDAARRKEY